MHVQLIKADKNQKPVIQNMGLLYAYDLSRYCGHYDIWRMPESGIYDEGFAHLDTYWEDPSRTPYIVRVNEELAGFVLINKVSSDPSVDHAVGEFFIMAKHQRQGVGLQVAQKVFSQHPGKWEVTVIPDNKLAEAFWDRVIHLTTQGNFTKDIRMIPDIPIPMYSYIFKT